LLAVVGSDDEDDDDKLIKLNDVKVNALLVIEKSI
jgi:hypothetical protein